ncbi:RNA-directed DNA polymerase (Reverse transcriptase) [Trifolium medium]|uniref:RNA-directed DNA polymerase (Reverse transcriptase) n=1 Tax=Trifolium medium TaxID=97028 RepID=A0A392M339_9FABA|nr:RNA-directed DNA polymerase (Reverse transcriptase) [Trifolium medium]
MRKSKKKSGDMVFKLDLEKAYDRVNWSFLKDTLVMFKFPQHIISLIMFGITSSSNAILWNGSKTEAFTPKRGLRQGDPLSPYLFVLCMERLGALISKHVRDGTWSPMQITKKGTKNSHLFFADDVLLFAKANVSQARIVNEVLERFCAMSGLKTSLDKSKFCTSAGVCRRRRDSIAAVTHIHATDRFEKYLGFKMFYGKGMCDDLVRTVRRFIWKGTGDTGMHLIGWDKITQPRRFGGLGVHIARLQNVSLLGKLIWEVSNSPGKLWVKLFADKYLKGRSIFNVSVSGGSCIWNSLSKALHMLRDGFTFKIGDGNSRFWYDPWVLKEKLCSVVPFVAIQVTEFKINDVWVNGRWNLEKLYTKL